MPRGPHLRFSVPLLRGLGLSWLRWICVEEDQRPLVFGPVTPSSQFSERSKVRRATPPVPRLGGPLMRRRRSCDRGPRCTIPRACSAAGGPRTPTGPAPAEICRPRCRLGRHGHLPVLGPLRQAPGVQSRSRTAPLKPRRKIKMAVRRWRQPRSPSTALSRSSAVGSKLQGEFPGGPPTVPRLFSLRSLASTQDSM